MLPNRHGCSTLRLVPEERVAAAEAAGSTGAAGSAGDTGTAGSGGFGEVLRELRLARGVSQAAVASRAGIDRSYVNRLEAGERGAPAEAGTEALARALDLT